MAAKGRNVLIRVNVGGTQTLVAGMVSKIYTISRDTTEIQTNPLGQGLGPIWRELMPGLDTKATIGGSCVFKDDAAMNVLEDLSNSGEAEAFEVEFENGDVLSGNFLVTSYEYTGEYLDAQRGSMTLESSGGTPESITMARASAPAPAPAPDPGPGPGPVDPGIPLFPWSVGADDSGQLGINTGDFLDKNVPQSMDNVKEWSVMNAGRSSQVLFIKSNGTLWGCGWNNSGMLGGLGTYTLVLAQIGVATNWTNVSAHDGHTYLINSLGELYAMGRNLDGELGQGTVDAGSSTPLQIGVATNWTECAGGRRCGYFINSLGELWGCGLNNQGQMGQGNIVTPQSSIVQIGVATNWSKANGYHGSSYFINSLGELWGCGRNNEGELGQGTTTANITSLVQIGSATNWVQASAGQAFGWFINSLGELWGVGSNSNGQLGTGATGPNILNLVKVDSTDNWIKLATSDFSGAAINDLGEVWTIGFNGSGQCGQGDFDLNKLIMGQVVGGDTDYADISAGGANLWLRKDTAV